MSQLKQLKAFLQSFQAFTFQRLVGYLGAHNQLVHPGRFTSCDGLQFFMSFS